MHIKRFIGAFVIALTASCASTDIELKQSKFTTRIASSGLKHFEVSIINRRMQPQNLNAPANRQGRPQERRVDPERIKKQLSAYANAHIDINNYCRKGFWPMEVNAYGPAISMRGECNDAATDSDRQKFPDTIKRW